jgi:hypothetical protein
MPSKERVLHGQVRFADGANQALRDWQPGDLPGVIGALCEDRGINFIDLTPALVNETNRTRQLLFNAIYDTHLNAAGARVVADVMARYLSGGGRDGNGR